MTVVFDLLGVQNRDHGERGIARYVANLALAVESDHPNIVDRYLIHPDLPIPESLNPILSSRKAIRADDYEDAALSPSAGGVFICGSLFELEQPLDAVLPAWARTPQWRRVAVLYDLIPLRFPDHYLADNRLRMRYQARVEALKVFDHLLAISDASAADASELVGLNSDQLSSIGAGADPQFRHPSTSPETVARRLVSRGTFPGLRSGYILFPTGFDFRKNIDAFVRAYAALSPELRSDHQLVMMCGLNEPQMLYMTDLLAEVGLRRDEVLLTGRVSDAELVDLNQGAHLVVFPSLYEGFGLPVLEARKCGAAVICGDNSSLREIQTDPTARFDAGNVSEMTRAMSRALTVHGEIDRLRNQPAPSYSWADCAASTADVIGRLAATAKSAPLPSLAIISPMPPQQSGIATYTARLVEHLQHFADITIFVETEAHEEQVPGAPAGVAIAPLSQLSATIEGGGSFDRLLYMIGNSRFHVGAAEALRKHPGVVLFHDVRLSSLYNESVRLGRNGISSAGAELARMYPQRYQPWLEQSTTIKPKDASRFGVLMTRDIAKSATKVLAHSPFAATLLKLDSGVDAEVCYPMPAPLIERPESADGPLLISSFGVVDPAKKPEAMIAAIADVQLAHPSVRLRLVGPIDPAYRSELESLIKRLQLSDRIEITGHLDSVEFARAQRATAIAVQLRAHTNGESSAAVAELLAAGIPTVVSNLGSMADLPEAVVVKIDNEEAASQLTRVLLDMARDTGLRNRLSVNAQIWARQNSFDMAAAKLATALFE